ncbi:MAG: DNA polymerase IV, partial [Acetatifactor sp.]|nr:DNA polymerase IV [Acetatifactor sp.]
TDLRQIPSIIGGDMSTRHGVVLAKSIPAKAYGIVTGEPVANAFRKCPGLVTAPPDHALYHKRSSEMIAYLAGVCPDLEQVSIDECYMDYTPISHNYASPETAAALIKDTIREKFGFTVNVGISDRKVLAKMASDFKKPDLVHTLYCGEIREKLWPLPVSSLFMCGRSSVNVLRNLGILTIGDLAKTDPSILESHLKSHGRTLWNYANGRDSSGIFSEPAKAKGIGNSVTLSADAVTREEAARFLLKLSESVGRRLRASHQLAGLVCTEIKYHTFRSVSHQTVLDVPTDSTDQIYRQACALFDELWDGTPIRLLGIRTGRLAEETDPIQLSLFDPDFSVSEKQKKLDAALDQIRSRFGQDAIKRGSLVDSPRSDL